MAIRDARPTEYKGIRYRSKSEAMFARFLELETQENVFMCSHEGPQFAGDCGRLKGGFVYEPEGIEVDGWKPDFLRWQVLGGFVHGCQIPVLSYTIIEYKPLKPTKTYAEEFALRCDSIVSRFDDVGLFEFSRRVSCEIFYGSVFNANRGRVIADGLELEWDDGDGSDWLANFEEEVKATRYDLCANFSM